MAIRINPKLIQELEKYGAEDVSNCYHCGNCSAACPFSKEPFVIPRKSMRHLQMGLEERLRGNLEPWLCYYCGECSKQCPRGAEPGETMMSLRRWLISRYDFTGISKWFYRSWKAELAALVLVAFATAVGFLGMGFRFGAGDLHTYAGPGALFPAHKVHLFDLALVGLILVLLTINGVRMWWFTTGRNPNLKISFWIYAKNIFLLPWHYFTQARYRQCEKKSPWGIHLGVFLGWVTMEILVIRFLEDFQAKETFWRLHLFGYLAAIGLMGGTLWALIGRLRKSEVHYKSTHPTDWIFLILIAGAALTGVVQHVVYRWLGMEAAANIAYLVHMMFVAPLLLIQIPFGKLSHLVFRPLAMYLASVHTEALARQQGVEKGGEAVRVAA